APAASDRGSANRDWPWRKSPARLCHFQQSRPRSLQSPGCCADRTPGRDCLQSRGCGSPRNLRLSFASRRLRLSLTSKQRHFDNEFGATTISRGYRTAASVTDYQVLYHGKANPGAGNCRLPVAFQSVELLENATPIRLGNTRAFVIYGEHRHTLARL